MKAVIMAGGEGTRLRPLTSTQPKPMLPIVNRPMMEHVITLLKSHGFDDIVVTVAFLANSIRTYFGDGSEFGVKLTYFSEETPLGTAGSVGNAREYLDEEFLVISGDVLTDIDLSEAMAFHRSKDAFSTIVLHPMDNPLEFGIVTTNPDGSIQRFLEKPSWGEVFSDTVNTGIYVLKPEIFDYIEPEKVSDFSSDVFPALLADGRRLFGFVSQDYWEDVGTLQGYMKAHRDALDQKVAVRVPGFSLMGGLWIGEGCEIDPTAEISEPSAIGDNVRIGAGVKIHPYSVIGSNVKIGAESVIEGTVVADNCFMGIGCHIRGAIIGRNSDLRKNVMVEDGAVLGDDCYIGEGAVIQPLVKIYPSKTVQSQAVVNTSIVWESRASRNIFSQDGVTGLANVDISPELAVRLALAFGTTLKSGSTVIASRDTSRTARVLKRALMVGLNSAGINVGDLEASSLPIARYQTRYSSATGGIRVSLVPGDPQAVIIRFLGEDGLDIGEADRRKIERALQREDFRKVLSAEIGDMEFPARTLEDYTQSMVDAVPISLIRSRRFKLVLDFSFGTVSLAAPVFLAKFGAEVLAVNPYAATSRSIASDRDIQRERMSKLVRDSGSDLGVIFDLGGETLELIDDKGRVISDQQLLCTMIELIGSLGRYKQLHLTVNSSQSTLALARSHALDVIWTRNSTAGLSQVFSEHEENIGELPIEDVLAFSPEGYFTFPDLLQAPDALLTLAMVLQSLASSKRSLSQVVDSVPAPHVVRESVHTPWELKGSLMRSLVEAEDVEKPGVLLLDGIRTVDSDGGFVLLSPDHEEARTNIWVEAPSHEEALAKAAVVRQRVSEILLLG